MLRLIDQRKGHLLHQLLLLKHFALQLFVFLNFLAQHQFECACLFILTQISLTFSLNSLTSALRIDTNLLISLNSAFFFILHFFADLRFCSSLESVSFTESFNVLTFFRGARTSLLLLILADQSLTSLIFCAFACHQDYYFLTLQENHSYYQFLTSFPFLIHSVCSQTCSKIARQKMINSS